MCLQTYQQTIRASETGNAGPTALGRGGHQGSPPAWSQKERRTGNFSATFFSIDNVLLKTETSVMLFPNRRNRRLAGASLRDEKEGELGFERGCISTDETFCTQLETRVDFFYFFARNPLKSPDSDE
jgi:hypothetical protein